MRNGRKNVGGKRAMLAGTFMYRWLSGPDRGPYADGITPPANTAVRWHSQSSTAKIHLESRKDIGRWRGDKTPELPREAGLDRVVFDVTDGTRQF